MLDPDASSPNISKTKITIPNDSTKIQEKVADRFSKSEALLNCHGERLF